MARATGDAGFLVEPLGITLIFLVFFEKAWV
jgi:hypothetical protein